MRRRSGTRRRLTNGPAKLVPASVGIDIARSNGARRVIRLRRRHVAPPIDSQLRRPDAIGITKAADCRQSAVLAGTGPDRVARTRIDRAGIFDRRASWQHGRRMDLLAELDARGLDPRHHRPRRCSPRGLARAHRDLHRLRPDGRLAARRPPRRPAVHAPLPARRSPPVPARRRRDRHGRRSRRPQRGAQPARRRHAAPQRRVHQGAADAAARLRAGSVAGDARQQRRLDRAASTCSSSCATSASTSPSTR